MRFENPHKAQFYAIHIIVVIIFSACLMMVGPMRGGLPVGGDISERMLYIQDHLCYWRFGWYLWMLSALGLLTFSFILHEHIGKSLLSNLGLSLVALGVAPDLIAEVLFAFVMPNLGSASENIDLFKFVENVAVYLTGFLGNGLYNLGGLLLTISLMYCKIVANWVVSMGIASWILGLGLSISVAIGSMFAAELLTGLSMGLNTSWMLVIAYTLIKKDAL